MHEYLRFLADLPDAPPVIQLDDGRHCSTCQLQDRFDCAECNACARSWQANGRRSGWVPQQLQFWPTPQVIA